MIIFITDQATYRFCEACRSPMKTIYDNDAVLFLKCPNIDDKILPHESSITYGAIKQLEAAGRQMLHPGIKYGG